MRSPLTLFRSISASRHALQPLKIGAIDWAFDRERIRTFADLGGVWAVDGAYSFYALGRGTGSAGVLVDDDLTDAARRRAKGRPGLRLIEGNFGDPGVASRVGAVDAILLFDVLLHQVAPNWDEVLEMYASHARVFVIVNPQLARRGRTIRLLDLGREEYLRLAPPDEHHRRAVDHLDDIHPRRGRPWRDAHDIWQWGITDEDLIACLARLGFRLVYLVNDGPWQSSAYFEYVAFVFRREG